MGNRPIDWGSVFVPFNRGKRRGNLHPCAVKGCPNKASGKYCRFHIGELRTQTDIPEGTPSRRQLREANQERLRRERKQS